MMLLIRVVGDGRVSTELVFLSCLIDPSFTKGTHVKYILLGITTKRKNSSKFLTFSLNFFGYSFLYNEVNYIEKFFA